MAVGDVAFMIQPGSGGRFMWFVDWWKGLGCVNPSPSVVTMCPVKPPTPAVSMKSS